MARLEIMEVMSSIHELCLARHRRPSDFLQKWGKRAGHIRRKETIRDVVYLTLHKMTWSILPLKKKTKQERETKERGKATSSEQSENFIMETSKQTKKIRCLWKKEWLDYKTLSSLKKIIRRLSLMSWPSYSDHCQGGTTHICSHLNDWHVLMIMNDILLAYSIYQTTGSQHVVISVISKIQLLCEAVTLQYFQLKIHHETW